MSVAVQQHRVVEGGSRARIATNLPGFHERRLGREIVLEVERGRVHIAHPHGLITDSEGVDFARRRRGGFACRKRRGRERCGVVRLLPDGRLDKSLSGDGTLVYDTPVQVKVWDVAVQGNGKILVAGGWGSYPTTDTLVQRFTESGTPDAFGPGGSSRRIINLGGNDEATSIALQPGGEVLVGSTSHTGQDRLIRLFAGGDQDTGFGSGGVLSLTYNLETVALAPDSCSG